MIKKIYILLFFIIIFGVPSEAYSQCGQELLELCYPKLGDFKYVNSFPVRIKKSKRGEPPSVMKQSMVLNSGTKYRFVIYNAEEFEGNLIVNIYNSSNLVGTSYDFSSGKSYESIDFDCKKPGIYYITFYFEDGKDGCSICVMGQREWKAQ